MKDFEKITTPEAAFKALNREFVLPDVSAWPEKHKLYAISDFLLVTIFEACNLKDGKVWEPDWLDTSDPKYEIRFWIDEDNSSPSGVGFSGATCAYWGASSGAGSRLCCRDRDIAKHIFNTFRSLFLDRILLTYKPTKK